MSNGDLTPVESATMMRLVGNKPVAQLDDGVFDEIIEVLQASPKSGLVMFRDEISPRQKKCLAKNGSILLVCVHTTTKEDPPEFSTINCLTHIDHKEYVIQNMGDLLKKWGYTTTQIGYIN